MPTVGEVSTARFGYITRMDNERKPKLVMEACLVGKKEEKDQTGMEGVC